MRTIELKVYKINEHPNKRACFEWIRNNWFDLNDHSLNEVVDSIKALNKIIGGSFDYSISTIPDRGEFIRFSDYDKNILKSLKYEECPLTGVWWDYSLIKGLQKGEPELVLDELHSDTDHLYSDEGLQDLCEANEYEFYENGSIF